MPVPPYPDLETIVEYARDRVNDAIIPGGQTLTDTGGFTIDYINLGWLKFQQFMVAQGYSTLDDEFQLSGIPAVTSLDPGSFVSLGWSGYNNQGNIVATFYLPQNLIVPYKMWERPTAAPGTTPGRYIEMSEIEKGLAAVDKQMWNDQWEWRGDEIRMPGARVPVDLRCKYWKYFPDFVPASTTPFADQTVPVLRCESGLAGFIASEFAAARGDIDGDKLMENAKQDAMLMLSLDSLGGRLVPKTSERGKMKDRYSGGQGQPS